jgi:hypothetical protein
MKILLGLMVFWTVSGCAYRTSDAEHYLGPVVYVTGSQATVQSMSEQIHFPALLEAGSQWGLSIGVMKRVRAVPLFMNDDPALMHKANMPERLLSWGGIWLSRNMLLNIGYLRVIQSSEPQFVARSVVGATATLGRETNALSAGSTQITYVRGVEDSLRILCYESAAPEKMVFVTVNKLDDVPIHFCKGMSPS